MANVNNENFFIFNVLEKFSQHYKKLWNYNVEVEPIDQTIETVQVSALRVNPFGRPGAMYELIRIRSLDGLVPCSLDAIHMGDNYNKIRIDNIDELFLILHSIMESDSTINIVKSLANEAATRRQGSRNITYNIAHHMFKGSDDHFYAAVTFGGVSGFLEEKQLKRIASSSDGNESAFSSYSEEKIVLTVIFTGSTKMMMSPSDADKLREDAIRSLRSKDTLKT